MENIEFDFIASGDHEAFVFAVDKQTFVKLTGEEPSEEFDKDTFKVNCYRIYPGNFFKSHRKYKIKLEFKEI